MRLALWLFSALALLSCEVGPEGHAPPAALSTRVVYDTLWGWHCDTAFYLARAKPGEYPDLRPPAPPVPGEIIKKDTIILFISTNCPISETPSFKKSYKNP